MPETPPNGLRGRTLATIPQIAALIAHIVDERKQLVDRLEAIASLTRVSAQQPRSTGLSTSANNSKPYPQ